MSSSRPRRASLLLVLGLLMACGRREPTPVVLTAEHQADIEAWRARRDQRLRSEDGWLTLVNLAWLEPGVNRVGAAPDSQVVLHGQGLPALVGTIAVGDSAVTFRPSPAVAVTVAGVRIGGEMTLVTDADGEPTTLAVGTIRFHVIRRNDRLAVRVKDTASPVRAAFQGMEYYPIDPAWRVVARFEPHQKTIPVPNVLGWVEDSPSPGVAIFEKDGETYRLEPILEPGETDYFFIFGDRTNGRETYGAGRFLYSKPAGPDGTVVLDFNKSYNPPCVFSAYATCPLPPPQNKLPIELRAGETKYTGPSSGPQHA